MIGRTSTNSIELRFIHQNRILNPFEPLQSARFSNLFCKKCVKPRPKLRKTKLRTLPNPAGLSHKNRTMNPPKPSIFRTLAPRTKFDPQTGFRPNIIISSVEKDFFLFFAAPISHPTIEPYNDYDISHLKKHPHHHSVS